MRLPHVKLRSGLQIPLRDGTELSANLYLPADLATLVPCIVMLTPYVADTCHERAMYFAERHLGCVVVDVRGRGNSQGRFQPYLQEAQDGFDVVEWVAKQSFCNGSVGMCGGSYLGYAQWATAKERPPHLKTIVPTAAPCLGVDFPMRNNIFYPYLVQWLCLTRGRASQTKTFADGRFWTSVFRRWHESGVAFSQLDARAGESSPILQEWLAHPQQGPYWDRFNPTGEEYGNLQLPVLTITGSYDDDQLGALAHYREHTRRASSEAREKHYLVIGPWNHAGTATAGSEAGGLHFGPASRLDLSKLHREWYAWVMEGGPKPEFLKQRFAYYVLGANRWRYAETLEAATSRHAHYFLASAGCAQSAFASGELTTTLVEGPCDQFTYDPRELNGPEVDAEACADGGSLIDQSLLLALTGRALVYHTAPFDDHSEITGFFRLTAWIAIDCPDTDLYVSVHEITGSGASIRLSTDAIRARYRCDLRVPQLIETKEPQLYDFDRFTFISRRIARGHRLRLVIAPLGRLIDSTFVQKNYNGGGVVAQETVADARAVTVRLFHDPKRPSVLHVPLGHAVSFDEPQAPPTAFLEPQAEKHSNEGARAARRD